MPYNLFISHSWAYSDAYENLCKMLNSDSTFAFANHSVPKDDPIHNAENDQQLAAAIRAEMAPASVVVVLAGVYATYSKWINVEVRLAKEGFLYRKPIVAVEPWGAERTSQFVKENADQIVGWNTQSIVRAIRELA